MVKLYAKNRIVMPDDTIVERKEVFEATPTQAKQFDALNAARPATAEEIKAAADAAAVADGTAFFSEAELAASERTVSSEVPQAAEKGRAK